MIPKTHDEVGILNTAINQMYDTVQKQIEMIKQEEQSKARAEIGMLTNQINPHFLYNTLECIHLEVISNHLTEAANMVENLGLFLRIGLSGGNSLISLKQEISHAEKYINIMNYRENSRIQFHSSISGISPDYKIIKLLRQPLAENSIKHSFGQKGINSIVFLQSFKLKFSTKTTILKFVLRIMELALISIKPKMLCMESKCLMYSKHMSD